MTIAEEKKTLRSELRTKARTLDADYQEYASREICIRLMEHPVYTAAKMVLAFVGAKHEINTDYFLRSTWESGKTLCVPRCKEGHLMDFCVIKSYEDLEKGAYGIWEPKQECPIVNPESIDFAVIPCLSFDRSGTRLGQGEDITIAFLTHSDALHFSFVAKSWLANLSLVKRMTASALIL